MARIINKCNIVVINGTNRKGSSYNMGKIFCDGIKEKVNNVEIEEFFLPRDLNGFCLGCYNCIEDESKCFKYESKKIILEAMEKADILVFTTPNYCMSISAAMKSFLDFFFDLWLTHRPKEWMFHKKAVIFSAAAGASPSEGIKLLKTNLNGMGVSYVKSYGRPVQAKAWEEVNYQKKEDIKEDIIKLSKKVLYKKNTVSLKIKIMFKFFRFLKIKNWNSSPLEKDYWNSKGWLGKSRPWNNK